MIRRSNRHESMNLDEHAAKTLLQDEGVAIPRGGMARSVEETGRLAEELGGPVVLKALVPMGKRGKSGLVRLAADASQAREQASLLFGADAAGHPVDSVRVEERVSIASELYLAVVNDTRARAPRLLFSTEGGMEIEELHAKRPELVFELVIDPRHGLGSEELEALLAPSGLETAVAGKLHTLLQKLYGLFSQWDAELLEINPLALDTTGDLVALDCKLTIDDASLHRQPKLPEASRTGTELEKRAHEAGLFYIELDGDVGVLANGAGLTMCTLDTVAFYGGKAANFMEIGGDAYRKATEALDIVLANPRVKSLLVNLCGAYARTDVMMEGLLEGWKELKPDVPVSFSVHGTGEDRAIELLRDRLGIEPHDVMDDAVRQAIHMAATR